MRIGVSDARGVEDRDHAGDRVAVYAGLHTTHSGSPAQHHGGGLQVAAELVGAGAGVAELCERLCRSQVRSEFDLAASSTPTPGLRRTGSSRTARRRTTRSGLRLHRADIDDQVTSPIAQGIRVAILFTEGKRGRIRVNFRGEAARACWNWPEASRRRTQRRGRSDRGRAMEPVVADVLERAARFLAP